MRARRMSLLKFLFLSPRKKKNFFSQVKSGGGFDIGIGKYRKTIYTFKKS